jgi:hypothetical protein
MHDEIVQVFNAAIREFGAYNRLTNNCRTFLQWGCMGILNLTAVWHEDMLLTDVGAPLLLAQMALLMYRSMLREFCRWFWSVRWGPGKFQPPLNQGQALILYAQIGNPPYAMKAILWTWPTMM